MGIFKVINLKEHKHPYVHCSIIYNHKIWRQPKCPSVDEWIKQLWNISTMEYSLAIKKNKILPFATAQIELGSIVLSKINQTENDKYNMVLLMCGI